MLVDLVMIVAGLVVLLLGGEWLVRGASLLATRLGIPPIVIGVTIVAIGTSTPELGVSLNAATGGANDIALGNVIGSNIANILLILGISATIRAVHTAPSMTGVHIPIMLVVLLTLVLMLFDGDLGRMDSLLLTAGMAAYILYTIHEARRDGSSTREEDVYEMPPGKGRGHFLLLIVSGLTLLMLGARLLVIGAVGLARDAGITEAFIGLTIVSVGTSLPELTTSVIAAVRKLGDIAIGNIIGSNIFNVLFILGSTGLITPLMQGGVTNVDMTVMVLSSLLVWVLLMFSKRISRLAGGVMLASYVAYTGWLAAQL